jgi:polyketide synthase PksN
MLHPLLHANTSDLAGQRYSCVFNGDEFFFAEHVAGGPRLMAAGACLEMARAAVAQASGLAADIAIGLRNVVWAQPIAAGAGPVCVHIGLYGESDGAIAFEIYTDIAGEAGGALIHVQGLAVAGTPAAVDRRDMAALQEQCPQQVGAQECEALLREKGLDRGGAPGSLAGVQLGQGQVLAKLVAPAGADGHYVLQPAIVEGALQAARGWLVGHAGGPAALPSALQELALLRPCPAATWAVLRHGAGSQAGDGGGRVDIDLCEADGTVCARITGLRLRQPASVQAEADSARTLLFQTQWQPRAPVLDAPPVYARRVALLCGVDPAVAAEVAQAMPELRLLPAAPETDDIAQQYQQNVQTLLAEVQAILQGNPVGTVLVQVVVPLRGEQQILAGLSGLLKAARLENGKLMGQVIAIDAGRDAGDLMASLQENARSPQDQQVRHEGAARLVAGWQEVAPAAAVAPPWKDGGVYLITGGAGGLGRLFAGEIARHSKGAVLVLTGRAALDAGKQALLDELAQQGARAVYRTLDVADAAAVGALVDAIVAEFGALHGIVHSAGTTRDSFLIRKTAQDCATVLAPKVAGLVNLDLASKDLALDLFLCFSSLAGALGNVGQGDYAAANAFMDAYAAYRNGLVALQQRQGQTLSLDWPLWQDGGMQVDATTLAMIVRTTGMTPLQTASGIAALYRALSAAQDRVVVMEGAPGRLRALLAMGAALPKEAPAVAPADVDPTVLRNKVEHQLKVLLASVTEYGVGSIDADESFEAYGINSVMIMQIHGQMEAVFGELSKTLFFEYATVRALAGYLVRDHGQACRGWTGLAERLPVAAPTSPDTAAADGATPVLASFRARQRSATRSAGAHQGAREPIAIIAVDGRYPKAATLDQYWDNLKAGRDCISEIPPERWSLDGFFDASPEAATDGKSYSKWGGFIDRFAEFDALFFNISPREAVNMDPQERLFVQSCWSLLEDAGYTRAHLAEKYQSRVGVFAGITKNGFDLHGPDLWRAGQQVYPHTSFGSVANRVSYLLNLHGPSMPVDTMCSSSLTAIHEACEHIYRGECELAIAGGVNLYLHPSTYVGLCGVRMLSADGQCKSFGEGGQGFVPGEGVGSVLLKRLSQAEADGDHIYGLIRATQINHGGKTNGYMVPNPNAQAALIRAALDKAGVDARTVSYVEAHGTGTELGDPIEIAGLTQAFRKDTADRQFCAIGSVKSNIGHLEAAAGIAGVTKILLAMQHKQLVPSLHSCVLNPHINFGASPFVVQQELAPWERPLVAIDGHTRQYPRIAGISSFGAGGANAHVVLEEYVAPAEAQRAVVTPERLALIVLSARNAARLREQAALLAAWIERHAPTAHDLADMAYTLQLGREAMDERLAIIAGSVEMLSARLAAWLDGRSDVDDIFQGQVKRNRETVGVLADDEDMALAIDAWLLKGKHGKVLELWVKGLDIDWNKLHGAQTPRRISLPTYPFAREHYWVPKTDAQAPRAIPGQPAAGNALHPLLQQNTSDFAAQRFSSTFSGAEFFLADHVVQGKRVLPGVSYLEMARAAVAQAAALAQDAPVGLKQVVWTRPVIVGDAPVHVHIGLYPEDNGEIAYEVYSDGEGGDVLVHCQGVALTGPAPAAGRTDIAALQAQCTQHWTGQQCYGFFTRMGLAYGARFQAIEALYVGDGQVLAKLSAPAGTQGSYVLHPSMMDGALQASIGLFASAFDAHDDGKVKTALPFALQEIEVLGACTSTMWAHLRFGAGSGPADKVQKLDIVLCDADGAVCVRMKGYSSRVVTAELGSSGEAVGDILLGMHWTAQPVSAGAVAPVYAQRVVVLCGIDAIDPASLSCQYPALRCLAVPAQSAGIAEQYQRSVHAVLAEVQAILNGQPEGPVLLQVVVPAQGEAQELAGLSGLLRSARLENAKLFGQVIAVDAGQDGAALSAQLEENSRSPQDQQIRYDGAVRQVALWQELPASPPALPWKDGGVYLITGGAGGLGRIFADDIARRSRGAVLVLSGRAPLDAGKQAQLDGLAALGARAVYRTLDVADASAVGALVDDVVAEFGALHGIVHSAGVNHDSFIVRKTAEECAAVLAPKVAGLVNLDLASNCRWTCSSASRQWRRRWAISARRTTRRPTPSWTPTRPGATRWWGWRSGTAGPCR